MLHGPWHLAPATKQFGWVGKQRPFPLAIRGILAAAAILTLLPVAFHIPVAESSDIWALFDEFWLAFVALPAALLVAILGRSAGGLRDSAAGFAVGLSAAILGQLGGIREYEAGDGYLDSGFWMLSVASLATVATIGGWAAVNSGWAFPRWLALGIMLLGLANIAIGPGLWMFVAGGFAAVISLGVWWGATSRWNPGRWLAFGTVMLGVLVASDWLGPRVDYDPESAPSNLVLLTVLGVFLLATVLRPNDWATYAIAFCVIALIGTDWHGLQDHDFSLLPEPWQSTSGVMVFPGWAAVAIGLLGLGVIGDRDRDRFFLCTARLAATLGLLRPGGTLHLDGLDRRHLMAIAVIAVLAVTTIARTAPAAATPPG
ncbi:hypothetical protein BCD48_31600 [Pseudofrankia sp. BMG5.36]|nr:hypothetical protein BCD48_31600 [Pseudofrankia sp. BMG5.36]